MGDESQAAAFGRVLDEARHAMGARARRLLAIERFVTALTRDSLGKRFTIHHDIIWLMALDCRDKLVIDLADWARASHLKGVGGFLRVIHGSHLSLLSARRPWGRDKNNDAFADEHDKTHADSRARLFPKAGEKTSPEDFEGLITEFVERFKPLAEDRHHNRAHEYEHEKRKTVKAKMLDVKEIRELVEYAHRVIRDLSLVGRGASFDLALAQRIASDPQEVGYELSEMTLVSPTARMMLRKSGIATDRFLQDLHDNDTSPPPAPDDDDAVPPRPTFNDLDATWRGLVRLGLSSLRSDRTQ